jgi:hypothetical protein
MGILKKPRAPVLEPRIAVGLAEIAAWHDAFVGGHTQRLKDLDLPPEQFDRDLAEVTRIAAAMVEKMRELFLANATRR